MATAKTAAPVAFVTLAAFIANGHAVAVGVATSQDSLASIVLSASVYFAGDKPGQSVAACVSQAVDALATNAKGKVHTGAAGVLATYESMAKNAVGALRAETGFPQWDESVTEKARLAKVRSFIGKRTLRKLSGAVTSLRSDNAAVKRDEKAEAAKVAEATVREAAGVQGDSGMSLSKLIAGLSPYVTAAQSGDATARAALAFAFASYMDAKAAWEEADATTVQQVETLLAANG